MQVFGAEKVRRVKKSATNDPEPTQSRPETEPQSDTKKTPAKIHSIR